MEYREQEHLENIAEAEKYRNNIVRNQMLKATSKYPMPEEWAIEEFLEDTIEDAMEIVLYLDMVRTRS